MRFTQVNEETIPQAGWIHSESWKASHRSFCSAAFVEAHTPAAQADYLRREMAAGKRVYLLYAPGPVGIVSICGSLIENLYILPAEQKKGYGTALLEFAVSQCEGPPRLWVLSSNEGARRLYHRMGFVETGKQTWLNDSLYELEMEKKE